MDIVRSPLKGKTGRLLIRATVVGLNLGACIAIGITVSNLDKWDTKTKNGDSWWTVAAWLNIMVIQLLLSSSGVCLYFLGDLCVDQNNWLMISGIYNMVNSIVIIYGYLLGSQRIFNNCFKKGLGIKGSCKWNTKHDAALAGAIICILVSILNFFAAFYPFPLWKNTGSNVEKGVVVPQTSVDTPSNAEVADSRAAIYSEFENTVRAISDTNLHLKSADSTHDGKPADSTNRHNSVDSTHDRKSADSNDIKMKTLEDPS